MPSTALKFWRSDRLARLAEVEAHCSYVSALTPPNPKFEDECLRGYVLHLSAHFQGFCRDLYAECSQVWTGAIPASFQASAQSQFEAGLALEKGNPTYDNLRKDFNRFGWILDLPAAHASGSQWVTDLDLMNRWRNKAAHQIDGTCTPAVLTVPALSGWRSSCEGLANALDGIAYDGLLAIIGIPPW